MADVSRETPPAPDPDLDVVGRIVPADRLPALTRYAAQLASTGVIRGLIGPREVPRLWDRHLVNCALVAPFVDESARVVDVGSGAGLPGLVLAIVRPDLDVTLVEPMARRVDFLAEVVDDLGLANVSVVRERAGQWREAPTFSVATARAVAPLAKLLTWTMPLVRPGGELLAMKGASATDEIAAAGPELSRYGARAEIVTSAVEGSSTTTVVRVVRDRLPRIGCRGSRGDRGRRGHG